MAALRLREMLRRRLFQKPSLRLTMHTKNPRRGPSPWTRAAWTVKHAQARHCPGKKKALMTKKNSSEANEKKTVELEALKVPTDRAALVDGPAYVRSVAKHVDLVAASARLVVSSDEKVSKAELDRLRELIFGKGGPPAGDEPLRIDWEGVPRPDRERNNLMESERARDDH